MQLGLQSCYIQFLINTRIFRFKDIDSLTLLNSCDFGRLSLEFVEEIFFQRDRLLGEQLITRR